MTWTTIALIFVAWCLVSVVAGFAFAYFFGGLTRIHPDEIGAAHTQRVGQDQEKASKRFPRRRVRAHAKPRARAGAAYRPLVVGGAPDPPLEDE